MDISEWSVREGVGVLSCRAQLSERSEFFVPERKAPPLPQSPHNNQARTEVSPLNLP